MSTQELSANSEEVMDVQVVNQPMGGKRDTVIAEVSPQWQAEPACTIVKTGYGVNRRAYFLETCSFANAAVNTVCGIVPQRIEYRFFEGALVQVTYDFNDTFDDTIAQSSDRAAYRSCLQAQLEQADLLAGSAKVMGTGSGKDSVDASFLVLHYQIDDKKIELQVDNALRTSVSEIDSVSKIHLL